MALGDIKVPKENSQGTFEEVNLTRSDIGAAGLDSPAFTGTPTATTAAAGTNTTQIATTAFTLANRGDRYLTTSTSSHSLTTGSKTFTVQSGLSYTPTQDVTIVYDAARHMHGIVTSYSGTTLVVNIETVDGSGGPFTAWTINVGGLLTAQGALLEVNNLSDVTNPATALTNIGGVPTSRSISAGTGLTGGGDLTANRTLAVSYGTTAGTACQGNDARLSDSRTPSSHAASHAVGIKASFNDQVAGMSTNVFIRADNVGTAGNSITLAFDGVDDIDTVLVAWNAANTSNTAELVSGDGAQVPDNLEEIALSGGVAAGSDPLSFREISVTDPVSSETYTLKSGAPTTVAGNTGFGIYSESSESFPFITSPSGEVIFAGSGAFLGVADRTNAADRTLDKGLYGLNGCLNVYSQSLAKNTVSFGDNGDVLIGETNINSPSVVAGVSSWGKKFQVNGNVTIRDNTGNETATFDAQGKLTANRTYDLPDASGTLALTTTAPASHTHGNLTNDGKVGSTSGLPLVTTTAGAVTTLALGTAGQVLRTKSDLSGVEFADPAAAGVTSVTGTAPIVSSGGTTPAISVTVGTGANTVAAGNDSRITGAIQSTLVDAKGDLIVATAADTVARLPVGATNGHVLTVDSAEAGGMKWAAASGGLTGIASSASQVLGTSSGNITGVDGNTIDSADPFIKWNDTAARLEYANPLSRPAGAMYVGVAPTTTAIGTRALCIQADRSLAADRVPTGVDSVAIGNSSQAQNSGSTAIGFRARANNTYAVCIGGESAATGNSAVAIGGVASASGAQSINISAYDAYGGNSSSATNSVGLNATADLRAMFATAAFRSVYWGGQTTSDTANVELNLDATATNRMTIAANTAVLADIYVVARRTNDAANQKYLAARRWVAIRRDGSNNTSLIGANPVQTIGTDQTEGTVGWTFTIDADDTPSVESLRVRVTGTAGDTVNWRVCAIYRVVT